MDDLSGVRFPPALAAIYEESRGEGFDLVSEPPTGCLLRTLASSKPGGRFLELGTGTGAATAWILDGMDPRSRIVTVESDERFLSIARRHLGAHPRVTFVPADGNTFLHDARDRHAELAKRQEPFAIIFGCSDSRVPAEIVFDQGLETGEVDFF